MADLNIVMVHLQTFFSSKGVGRDPKSVQEYLADIGGAPFSRGLPKTQRWT